MGKIKACLGCFAEMDAEDKKCYKCGWKSGQAIVNKHRWCLGDVLEKRYLVGNIYYESEEEHIVIFYVYDKLLSIPCMALIKEGDEASYTQIAKRLQASYKGESGNLVILAIKMLQGKQVLLFSLENRHMPTSIFEICLHSSFKEEERHMSDRKVQKREHVLPSGVVLDERYRIEECIGVGGFGITYLCEDILLDRPVAIKEYFPSEWAEREETYVLIKQSKMLSAYRYGMESFMKEISITAKFIHTPHIPSVYDAFEANDTLYMVMEYVDGISVGRMMKIREYRPLEPEEVATVILPVLDALEAVHDKNIVHSDISPGNILYTENGSIYLIDMGAAKYTLDSQSVLDAIFLKIEYAAPEQYRTAVERKPADEGPWTDIYALGATMYFILTGNKPVDVISRLNGTNEDLGMDLKEEISVAWAGILDETMALDRTERIQSVPELRRKIEELVKNI